MPATAGIHHVTAIAKDPQRTIDFYVGALGLRLAKVTANYDDPGAYHFYFGDALGRPGTILTFFAWPAAAPGRPGSGEVATTSFEVPRGSAERWRARLVRAGVKVGEPVVRFGDAVLPLRDPDGLSLELVETDGLGAAAGDAIGGFHGVTLALDDTGPTRDVLTGLLGCRPAGRDPDGRERLTAQGPPSTSGAGRAIDLVQVAARRPMLGAGSVHHVAFRAEDDAQQAAFRGAATAAGLAVTPVQERNYFRSIYFREPGHVLFEIATDSPGFTVDQSDEDLGTALMLPPWLEPRRREIEAALPPIVYPSPRRMETPEPRR